MSCPSLRTDFAANWDGGGGGGTFIDTKVLRGTADQIIGGLALAPWCEASDAFVMINGQEWHLTPGHPVAFPFKQSDDLVLTALPRNSLFPAHHAMDSADNVLYRPRLDVVWWEGEVDPASIHRKRAPFYKAFGPVTIQENIDDTVVAAVHTRYRKAITVFTSLLGQNNDQSPDLRINGYSYGPQLGARAIDQPWGPDALTAAVSIVSADVVLSTTDGTDQRNIVSPHDLIELEVDNNDGTYDVFVSGHFLLFDEAL